ncbi:MAG: AEC family transporter [Lachnospiraceae bacterium]|nr:AEC family transporter [Lachnospiraceae bacterium]
MLENFLMALNVVFPMTVLIAIGCGIRKKKLIDRPTMRNVDKLTFHIFMPMLLFKNIYESDFSGGVDLKLLVFAAISMTAIFGLAMLLPRRFLSDPKQQAAVGQAMIRSNNILFGIAAGEAIYGPGKFGQIAALSALAVPLSNALGVIIIEWTLSGKAKPGKIIRSVLKNPMVRMTILSFICLALPFRLPDLIWSIIKSLAGVATTISFLSLGVSLDMGEMQANRYPIGLGLLFRILLIQVIFIPISLLLGFRSQSLCGLIILFASPVAVASYPMAVVMGADGQLAGQLVCFTTLISVVTLFLYTFGFGTLGLL